MAAIRFLLATLLLAGCAAPDLGPAPRPREATALPAVQTIPAGTASWPADEWWRGFGDPQLDRLEAEALAGSPDIVAAAARLRRAEGLARQAGAALAPTIEGQASAGLVKQSYNNGIPRQFVPKGWNSTGNLALRFGLDLDFWGRNHAALRAAVAEREAARIEAAAARLALTAGVADAYAELALLHARRKVAAEALRIQGESLRLVANRVDIGLDTPGQREQAAANVPAARADLAAIDESIDLTRDRLAALLGAGPDRGRAITPPTLPLRLPGGLPPAAAIDLVGRRPDIAAARARAEAASQRVKGARADFYPNINLSALIGLQSLGLSNLLEKGSSYGNVGPALSLPVFDGGLRAGRYRVARADYDAAVADYDRTLTDALRDLADVVTSRRALVARAADANAAVARNEAAWRIARLRYEGGLATYLDVLTVEQALIASRQAATDLAARAYTLDIALARALGGGFADGKG